MGFSLGGLVGGLTKSVGNIFKGKISLNDILNVGSVLSPGMDITKLGLGNIGSKSVINNLGLQNLLSGKGSPLDYLNTYNLLFGDQSGSNKLNLGSISKLGIPTESKAANQFILEQLLPLALKDLEFKKTTQPMRQGITLNGVAALDPANNGVKAIRVGNADAQAAATTAESQARQLKANGYSPAVLAGLMHDAGNRGLDSRADAQEAYNSPDYIARQRTSQLSLLSDAELEKNLNEALAVLGQQYNIDRNTAAARDARTGMDDILMNLLGSAVGSSSNSDLQEIWNWLNGRLKSPSQVSPKPSWVNDTQATGNTNALNYFSLLNQLFSGASK